MTLPLTTLPRTAFHQARRAARAIGFGGWTAATSAALAGHQALRSRPGDPDLRDAWVRAWADGMLKLFSIELSLHGTIAIPEGHGALIVGNHRSSFDAPLFLRTFGGQLVARGDIANWPIVGGATRRIGTIFVDRSNALSGAATMRTIRSKLQSGARIGLFPEGTTFIGDEVRPFHPGSFVAAQGTRTTVVPFGIAYEEGSPILFVNEGFGDHARRVSDAPPSRVTMVVGESFPVREGAKARAIAEETHARVQALVTEARRLTV